MATSLTFKRLLKDVSDIYKNPLIEDGIYYQQNEEDMMKGHAMIIGRKGTPYEDGVYFFELLFHDDYPHNPPKVTITSYQDNVRINPNLYRNGKVCLSILNNWHGDGWTSCQNIRSLLLTIASIMNDEPLLNEPGICSKKHKKEIELYKKCITYQTFKGGILDMFQQKNIYERQLFEPYIYKHLRECKERLMERLEKELKKNPREESYYCKVYSFHVHMNYPNKKREILELYNKIE